jgi:hypothetical protein
MIRVPDERLKDIESLLANDDVFESIKSLPGWDDLDILTVEDYTRFLLKHLPDETANAFARISVSFRRLSRVYAKSYETVVDEILAYLTSRMNWEEKKSKHFRSRFMYLQDVIEGERLSVVEKASDLYQSTTNTFNFLKFITTTKPIFNKDRGEIAGYILGTQCNMSISNGGTEEYEYVVDLGPTELRAMREEIDRALVKLDTVERSLKLANIQIVKYDT